MPTTSQIEITDLVLDLKNFRTVPQNKEANAIKAMISIKPERFFAVMESIIEDGYLPTENIIILNDGTSNIVKEGNRRIASLKLIHGQYKISDFGLPTSIIDSINKLDPKWKTENLKVPCTVFPLTEKDKAEKVVALTHAKGERASRDPWNSVATARHNRDMKKAAEPALDLLEKYLKKGRNLNNQQKERWGGDYPLTVLAEALRKIFQRLGYQSSAEVVAVYPKLDKISELESIIRDIGLELIKFDTVRSADFPDNYGIPTIIIPPATLNQTTPNTPTNNANTGNTSPNTNTGNPSNTPATTNNSGSSSNTAAPNQNMTSSLPKAHAGNDPKYVAGLLKKFAPKGANRQKVVTLRDEIRKLKIKDNPIAFCFLLRSMFEISAKAYCGDHRISTTKSGGKDKTLVEILRDINSHLTNGNSNIALVKVLHGAMTEIGKAEGILSVTSMNQLVHNPQFSVVPKDVCTLFGNVYPLLESMN